MATILVLHGPNLNLLGQREVSHYGSLTLADINAQLAVLAKTAGHHIICQQRNAEADLIEDIQQAPKQGVHFLIFNPAAFTHTSIALRDALLAVSLPFIEVHLSNIYARDAFRHHSYFSDIAKGTISGLGASSYYLALTYACEHLSLNSLNQD